MTLEFQILSYHTDNDKLVGVKHLEYSRDYVTSDNSGIFMDIPRTNWNLLKFHIYLFGRLRSGKSVMVRVPFRPSIVFRILADSASSIIDSITSSQRGMQPNKNVWFEHKMMHNAAGFHPDLKSPTPKFAEFGFLFIRFLSSPLMYSFIKQFKKDSRLERVEQFMQQHPIVQFFQETGIKPCSTVRVTRFSKLAEKLSYCDTEICADVADMHPVEEDIIFPIVITSFDIETVPEEGDHFPSADNKGDKIVCICNSTAAIGLDAPVRKSVHALGTYNIPDPVPANHSYFTYETEADLLLGWRDHLVWSDDPDIITGWNIDGYDWNYIHKRACLLVPDTRFLYFSRLLCMKAIFQDKTFSSGAYGTTENLNYKIHGRANMDLLTYVRRNFSSDNYRLDTIATKWLGQTKNDLPIKTMFAHWLSGDPAKRAIVNDYCLQDCLLPVLMLQKKIIIPAVVEMSRVTYVCLEQLFSAGQSLKVLSMLYVFARERNFVLCNFPDQKGDYMGATVLPVSVGLHHNATVFDFSSLYPSIMQAYNLDYTSYVHGPLDPAVTGFAFETIKTDIGEFTFQQTLPGLLPSMSKILLQRRSAAKRDMEKAESENDTYLAQILNAKQLALKVSANSIYGFTGATNVKYPLKAIAASTTAYGRRLLESTASMIQQQFSANKARILMGDTDSVFVALHNASTGAPCTVQESFVLGQEIQAFCNTKYKHPINITLEKVLSPLLSVAKKRYAGVIFKSAQDSGQVYVKGVEVIRRDYTPFQRCCIKQCLDTLLIRQDVKLAMDLLREQFDKLLAGQIPFEQNIKTAQLKDGYKSTHQAALVVSKEINKIIPGTVRVGDRVEMVPVFRPNQTSQYECDRYVDPRIFADKERKLQLDVSLIIEKMENSITNFFIHFDAEYQIKCFFKQYIGAAKNMLTKSRTFSSTPKQASVQYGKPTLKRKTAPSVGAQSTRKFR